MSTYPTVEIWKKIRFDFREECQRRGAWMIDVFADLVAGLEREDFHIAARAPEDCTKLALRPETHAALARMASVRRVPMNAIAEALITSWLEGEIELPSEVNDEDR
jgi:hypothetical protein